MDKYEYKNIQFYSGNRDSLETKLNQLGAQGWHVVAATPSSYESTPQTTIEGYRNIRYDILLERKVN